MLDEIGSSALVSWLDAMCRTGRVSFWQEGEWFGFITPDDGGRDVFVHYSAVKGLGGVLGAAVAFDEIVDEHKSKQGKRGKTCAANVVVIEKVMDSQDQLFQGDRRKRQRSRDRAAKHAARKARRLRRERAAKRGDKAFGVLVLFPQPYEVSDSSLEEVCPPGGAMCTKAVWHIGED